MATILRAKVYHHAFCDSGDAVAIVTFLNDAPLDTDRALGIAYRKTNTIDFPWWENSRVEMVGPAKLAGGCRSTSIGDLIQLELDDESAELYRVDRIGFSVLVK